MLFDIFESIESLWKQPSGWLAILLVFVVVWLVRVVLDLKSQVTLVRQAAAHGLTAPFLAQYTTTNNRRQLQRIRNAARRTNKAIQAGDVNPAAALHRFEKELDAEIKTLSAAFGPEHDDVEDPGSALSSSSQDDDDERQAEQDGADDSADELADDRLGNGALDDHDDGRGNDFEPPHKHQPPQRPRLHLDNDDPY